MRLLFGLTPSLLVSAGKLMTSPAVLGKIQALAETYPLAPLPGPSASQTAPLCDNPTTRLPVTGETGAVVHLCPSPLAHGAQGVVHLGLLERPSMSDAKVVVKFGISQATDRVYLSLMYPTDEEQRRLDEQIESEITNTQAFTGNPLFVQFLGRVWEDAGVATTGSGTHVRSRVGAIFEFIEGDTLEKTLKTTSAVAEPWVACITVQIFLAHMYTFVRGLKNPDMHRNNIMVEKTRQFKLNDQISCPAIRVIDLGTVRKLEYLRKPLQTRMKSESEGPLTIYHVFAENNPGQSMTVHDAVIDLVEKFMNVHPIIKVAIQDTLNDDSIPDSFKTKIKVRFPDWEVISDHEYRLDTDYQDLIRKRDLLIIVPDANQNTLDQIKAVLKGIEAWRTAVDAVEHIPYVSSPAFKDISNCLQTAYDELTKRKTEIEDALKNKSRRPETRKTPPTIIIGVAGFLVFAGAAFIFWRRSK